MKIGLLDKRPEFWLAGAASIAIHVVLISAFCFLGGSGDKKGPSSEGKKRPAVVEETPSPLPPVDPVRTETPPPSIVEDAAVAPKPKSKPASRPAASKAKPAAKPVSKTDDEVSLASVTASPAKTAETGSYVVKAGDSLYKIARDFSCTVSELAKLNNTDIKKLANLKKGQSIRVPKSE